MLAVIASSWALATSAIAGPDRKNMELKVGGSELIELTYPVKRASIADPRVADIVVLSPKEIYAYGKQVGYTSVILWEEGTGNRTLLDMVVSLDVSLLKEKLRQLFPREKIEVHTSETGVVLSGTVSGPEVVEEVLRLTRTYLPAGEKAAGQEGAGSPGPAVTNLLTVGGSQQVLLEVKFAEVTRTSGKDWQASLGYSDFSNNFRGAAGTSPLGVSSLGNLAVDAGTFLLNFKGNAANIFVNIKDFTGALQFLEKEGLARTLAEPRLVTQSGKEASFLAGGEFPVPVSQEEGNITIDYKEFGVALRFTPIVMSDGKISLHVAPTVSQISSTSAIPAGIVGANFIVPNLSTRKLDTTVQLYEGQTLALAGLLQNDIREEVSKIPGLGDIPILGALFRSNSFKQDRTDLLIAVTPYLVKPAAQGSLGFPGEHMQIPDEYEFYLEGVLEGERDSSSVSNLSMHHFTSASPDTGEQGGLEGVFGYLPVRSTATEGKPQ
jgi:pilus assembly protein CpaC